MASKAGKAIQTVIVLIPSLVLLIVFNSSSPAAATPKRAYWPTAHWRSSTPEAQGMDSERLMKVIPFIIDNQLWGIQSLLVVRNGYVVFENYYGPGMPDKQETVHSVTKSITSALVGIARDRGLIGSLDQTLPGFFPEYFVDGPNLRKSITLKHLLTMTAGLKPVQVDDRSLMSRFYFAPDRVRFTLGLPLRDTPGEIFAYSNAVSDLLSKIVIKKTGMNLSQFADQTLFGPLGIKTRLWKMDAQGHNTGHGGLYLSTRDMAKIGFLYLNSGYWDGKRIISRQWIEASTRGQVEVDQNYSYGYQWWVRPVSGCPSYRAWGRNGQFIVVVPALDLVVAVTSETAMPGHASGHYAPLFDIIGDAVIDRPRRNGTAEEQVFSGQKNLPADIKAFLDHFSTAVESKKIDDILDHYSEAFLNSGRRKQATTGLFRLLTQAVDHFSIRIDQCRIRQDRATLWGEIATDMGPLALFVRELIREEGVWRWYGNQQEK